jgi:hypothetical protein
MLSRSQYGEGDQAGDRIAHGPDMFQELGGGKALGARKGGNRKARKTLLLRMHHALEAKPETEERAP